MRSLDFLDTFADGLSSNFGNIVEIQVKTDFTQILLGFEGFGNKKGSFCWDLIGIQVKVKGAKIYSWQMRLEMVQGINSDTVANQNKRVAF